MQRQTRTSESLLIALLVLVLASVSAQATENTFHAVINVNGWLEEGWCSGEYRDWYHYLRYDWWNGWFDNRPFDPSGQKQLSVSVTVSPVYVGTVAEVELAYNWSTPEWSSVGLGHPPFPADVEPPGAEDLYIERKTFHSGPIREPTTIHHSLLISDYCPEWVSIDIRGRNFRVDGVMKHDCILPDTEACCFDDGSCQNLTPEDCRADGGDPQGAGTQCLGDLDQDGIDDACEQPSPDEVACCLPDGSCVHLTPTACLVRGGSPRGPGSRCEDVDCPQPLQACCLLDGTCVDATENDCLAQGGTPQGVGTDCSTVDCLPCDWNAGDPHKMHWAQLPDLDRTGLDVDFRHRHGIAFGLADDFLCSATGPITDIHIWCSFKDDILPEDGPGSLRFSLVIRPNAPADDEKPWSRPEGPSLWRRVFDPGEYTVQLVHEGPQGWYGPEHSIYEPDDHEQTYQYNFCIDEEPFIQEEGTIYWLEFCPYGSLSGFLMGWKTTKPELRWNDDAVRNDLEFRRLDPITGWRPLKYPREHDYEWETLDLAFVVTGEPGPPPQPQACCLPDGACQNLTPGQCVEQGGTPMGVGTDCNTVDCPGPDECDWNPGDPHKMHWPQEPDFAASGLTYPLDGTQSLADDFLCTATGPIKDIHIWGGFLYDGLPSDGPGGVTFELAIYSNLPADSDTPFSRPRWLLWSRSFGPGEYTVSEVYDGPQTFLENHLFVAPIPDGHRKTYQYNFCIEDEPFTQEGGTIYWLEVKTTDRGGGRTFGWKTTSPELGWEDAAVLQLGGNWYPRGPGYMSEPLNFAFVITGGEGPPPQPQACCLLDGTCQNLTPSQCAEEGGTPQGTGTDCATVVCAEADECEWNLGDPHKMHFPQLPDLDPTGVDVEWERAGVQSLADDFLCSTTGPITDIHIWCSFYDDILPEDGPGSMSFYVAIRANRPAGDGVLFSMPQGDPLWSRTFSPGEYTLQLVHEGLQGWYNPGSLAVDYEPDNHQQTYQYNFCIDEDPFIQEEGAIYWLEVQARPSGLTDPDIKVGWKTTKRDLRWNDDAVKAHTLGGVTMYSRLQYPDGHEYEQETLDLAFVITGEGDESIHELGDAPDSSNSWAGSPVMTAYPTVKARFPTVYGAGSPPHGPLHLQPKAAAWLGPWVTLENEADIGPDEDGVNNIDPPNDSPDQDGADDGVQMPIALPYCQQTWFQYSVQLVPGKPNVDLYANVWFDFDRDGDWDDTHQCPGTAAPILVPEWAVQNQLIPGGMAPGFYIFATPLFRCWHPTAADEASPIWMRITLSEQRWSPTTTGIVGHGGSGPANGYVYGETEDYYFEPGSPGPQACCFPDGTCQNLTPIRCVEAGGVPQGLGTDCTTVECPGDCDWQVGDPHKMHFPQLPDPNGWDIDVTAAAGDPWRSSADDWKCTKTGPVTDFHFWCSWWHDRVGTVENIRITIYDDDRSGSYSKPGEELWSRDFGPDEFNLCFYSEGEQGFIHRASGPPAHGWVAYPNDHRDIYQCDIINVPDPFIQHEGRMYWLQLHITISEAEGTRIGWKTSREHFEDYAVVGSGTGQWVPWTLPDGESPDLAFVITGAGGPGERLEFGDAPEAALAYPSICVQGAFPTCINVGPANWIQHNNFGAYFGPKVDFEPDGNAGMCPVFTPNTYNQDECFQNGDAGLIMPAAYTITGPVGSETVVPCVAASTGSLGGVCSTAAWGANIDVEVHNHMPSGTIGYVNVLIDWNRDGRWGGSLPCPSGVPAPEHVLVNFRVPNPYDGPLSGLNPPGFLIGPYAGYVWARVTITEKPVPVGWTGDGSFEDGETEDYLLLVSAALKPYDCHWQEGDPHKMHWPQLPDLNPTGLDIDMFWTPLADDFQCTQTGRIRDIHIWGSFADDCLPPQGVGGLTFQITIRANIAEDTLIPWSRPGEELWTRRFNPCEYTVRRVADDAVEGWYDPASGLYQPANHFQAYQYNFCIDEDEAFLQHNGTIYWLEVKDVQPASAEARYTFGWKTTSPDLHYMDDAVWSNPGEAIRTSWQPLVYPEDHEYAGQTIDLAFVITGDGGGPGERLEFGDAPEAAPAYPSICVQGAFPTCINTGPAGWIQHNNFGAYFGPRVDFEPEGNAGLCPVFNPNRYNQDECFQDGDAGLMMPAAYTITGPIGSETVVPCLASHTGALGRVCDMAVWGANVDIDVHNHMPSGTIGYVNVLMDFNRDGSWPGLTTTCPGPPAALVPEHVLVNFPVPNPYDGPLSALNPPSFQIGAYPGYVWTRFTITEKPVPVSKSGWNGEGNFEDGESEDYLLYITPVKKPYDCDWQDGDPHKMHWPQLPDLDPTGMDVDMFWTPLADDFLCSETGPIRDIHIWGSFADDCLPPQGVDGLTFQITIRANIPEDALIPWSRPGDVLWTRQFNPCEYTVRQVADDAVEDWYDPATELYAPANHFKAYQYNFCITDDDPFVQKEGTIYWLEVKDIQPEGEEARYTFGWKTTSPELHYMDDAVWFSPDPTVPGGWLPLTYPEKHRYAGQTIDLAFVITGEEEPPPRDMDFGDAPDPTYPTLLPIGARHIILPGVFLGNGADPEPDGQPDAAATGDDNDGNNDDDGVILTSPLVPGGVTTVDVTASVRGILNAWCDFDSNGDWDGSGEHIFVDKQLDPGLNNLSFNVPAGATLGSTFARFRFSRSRGLDYKDLAQDGEVEDYLVDIEEPLEPKLPVKHLKWSQPPVEWHPKSTVPLYCGWDEPSICGAPALTGASSCKIVADDFRCLGRMPITSIHWWGSHLGWSESSPPHLPTAFHIGFWTNVPADPVANLPSRPGKLIWESYRNNYDWNLSGYDRFSREGQLIADNPLVDVKGTEDFNWTAWKGWWLRGNTADVRFTFTGIDTATISGSHVLVKLNLGVTNHVSGEEGLDGLVDVTINPGVTGWTYTLPDVLLNNLDPANHVYAMATGGTYETKACITVPKSYIRNGTLMIELHRHPDVKDGLPVAPVSTNQPIDMSTTPPTVPSGCYDLDDAHTAHIYVETTDSSGKVAANGEVTVWNLIDEREACFQYYAELHPDEYFWQDRYIDPDTGDTVFWISITAIYDGVIDPEFPWGWKTRPWHWMDDAVTFQVSRDALTTGLASDAAAVTPIEDAPLCCGLRSYDMTFELDTDPSYIKWERPFTGLRHWPHYEDEESIATGHTVTETVTKYIQEPELSQAGMDVDATAGESADWRPQTLADDFPCDTTGLITDIHIWGSWYDDNAPVEGPGALTFTLSIHKDVPAGESPTGYSMPGARLWTHDFKPGEFGVSTYATDLNEGYYIPCEPRYEWPGDSICYKYDFYIDPCDAFPQKGSSDDRKVYWLAVQAHVRPTPGAVVPRFGWKTSKTQWNDDAVWATGVAPIVDGWKELTHPQTGDSLDLAFAITTEHTVGELEIQRLVADDWLCDARTPITAAVWWGSYIGYRYQACACPQPQQPPVKPDYFLLSIWTGIPDPDPDNPEDYSHPGRKIWEYKAYDYDEVLVGFDKHPEHTVAAYPRIGTEPVFRYSVRLPKEKWFCQEEVDGVYWFSVVAVYEDPEGPPYPWGWTNHKCTAWEPPGLVEVAHWTFDEAAGLTAHDSSGNGNHGTLVGDPTWQPCCGMICGALDFDGDGDYVKTSDTTTGLDFAPGSFSASAWVNARAVTDGWRTILEYDRDGHHKNRFGMWLSSEGRFHFRVGADTKDSNQLLNAGEWYCLTGTYDAADKTMRLYIDGQLDSSAVHANGYKSSNAAKLTIGVRGWEDAEYFNGLIDDVRIYDRVLSADEVKALAGMGRNDDAVTGHLDLTGVTPEWAWDELHDQTGASEDMSFMLFTEPGCFPCCHEDYFEWLSVGKPDCWCIPRQCHGDTDGLTGGSTKTGVYYVGPPDLNVLVTAWLVKEPPHGPGIDSVPNGICADFAHDQGGSPKTGVYRAGPSDLNIMIANWLKKEPPHGPGIDPNCLDCP